MSNSNALQMFLISGEFKSASGYNYTVLFPFEKPFFEFKFNKMLLNTLGQSFWTKSIHWSILYLISIPILQNFMKNRPRFELRSTLILWNLFLAIFSIIGFMRVCPEFIFSLTEHGFEYTVCNNSFVDGVYGAWSLLFVLSKLFELMDTLFIILRKRELIFLHCYHHCSVLVYSWYSSAHFQATGRWFVFMNLLVHSLMYTYYAARAYGLKIPKYINKTITTLQITQMLFGIIVNFTAFSIKYRGNNECHVSDENLKFSLFLYTSYFILFVHYFYKTYIVPANRKSHQQNDASLTNLTKNVYKSIFGKKSDKKSN